jgi:hypothetical protein
VGNYRTERLNNAAKSVADLWRFYIVAIPYRIEPSQEQGLLLGYYIIILRRLDIFTHLTLVLLRIPRSTRATHGITRMTFERSRGRE